MVLEPLVNWLNGFDGDPLQAMPPSGAGVCRGAAAPERPLTSRTSVWRPLLRSAAGVIFGSATLLLAVGTVAGLVWLWPEGQPAGELPAPLRAEAERAEAIAVERRPCASPQARDCRLVRILLLSGRDQGERSELTLGETLADPQIGVGDRLRVVRTGVPEGAGTVDVQPYALADFERRFEMSTLLIAYVALVILLGRWRGALSLVGLAVSLAVVILFIVPAILTGRPALAVAVVGSFAIMLATIVLTHGVSPKSIAAALGTAASLVLTIGLAVAFTEIANLSGFSSEEATLLGATVRDLSPAALVLAGMVIGALGVLDDVTVSQASTVLALRRANPALAFGDLYRRALAVGRDHVTATVNTLVLAYVGASLPVLLIFSVGGVGFADAINREAVAEQVIATLVGSIGLIVAVPLTTALAGLMAINLEPHQLAADSHGDH